MIWIIKVWLSLLLSQVRSMEIEGPPEKLQVHCWAISYPEKIQCTWDLLPKPHLHTVFITTYRVGLLDPEPSKQCIQSDQKPHSCLIADFQMFADDPYIFNVTAINPLGSITQLFPFIVENIIRPDPPENVTLSQMVGERKKLRLHWSPPQSWPLPEEFPLKYMIRYKRAGAKHYRKIDTHESTSFTLLGLKPRSVVQVQVAAKDFTDYGVYSDWSVTVEGSP
uniref:Epstein-Barr virus induced 3 n=1 Tax=Leptobrachium leishanense TaxID=445787 RepID=A0A8C5M6S7_9ANUR